MMLADIASFYGGELFGGTIEVDYEGNNAGGILDDRSWYKRGLKLWFTANQMGILDPDSVNQGWNEYLEKTSAGRNLLSLWPWSSGDFNTPERARAKVGFKLVPFNKEKQTARGNGPNYVGASWSWHVSKKTKKLDDALKFINYMWSYDGLWNMAYGRKGVYWDAGADNKPFMTELAYKINDRIQEFPNGGYAWDGINVINSAGINVNRMIHPVYGIGNRDLWEKKSFAPQDNALTADWKAVMNARDDFDYFTRHNMTTEQPFAPMSPAPDNILQIMARVGQVVQPASWQMVYARNEAEFNQIWQDMVTRARGVGMDTAVKWYIDEYNRAKSFGSKYAN
jgi:putative aldouronate transport system substrate-binding protein